ncbi:MAG: bifunctional UDP-N-acetylmuramoyl-tripeptide:D-alanyl-D-alanine ligase/alanine racemase [Flavobacteriaceae bacterium]|jgi:alanine racemase|nr:bifunctional UDP-N-acetylmuramoyl-tripeptide:D-alanyl-D-alanine ligase/alanine racemase [Flavobacteriaceae bacterium]
MTHSAIKLAKIINAEIIGDVHKNIDEIFFDSRSIIAPKNGIFFAINAIHDGHLYMEEAYKKSIRIFVCSHIDVPHEDAVYLLVENPVSALQKWAAHHLSQYHFPTVGITGSNGKTIVKEWLYQCIWDKLDIVRSPKSYNSQIGLPLSILQASKKNNLGIFEVGISHPQEMAKLEEIFHPNIGVLTNVAATHSEYFESRTEHIAEKIILFKHSDTIIYNNEKKEVEQQIRRKYSEKKLISFGKKNADICLIDKSVLGNQTTLVVSVFGQENLFTIPFSDEASVQNILCLIAVLYELGFDIDFIRERFLQLQSVSMRLELIKGLSNSLIINDSFNSDYKSLEIALNFLFQQNKPKKVLILSDILQSHIPEKELYKQVSSLVNSFPLDSVFLVGESLEKHKNLFSGEVRAYSTTEEIIGFLENYGLKDTAVLLKGARKYQLETVAAQLETQTHDTIMEVNLHSLMMNIYYFKSLLKPETQVIAMVKASSYGTGSFEVAEVLQYYHIDYLSVAYADEGAYLRERGIFLPIMVMNPEVSSYDMVIDNNLEPEIYSFRVLEKFIKKLKEKSVSKKYPIHIKIDTGMHRLGFQPEEVQLLAGLLKDNPFVEVKSVFSHFAVSDDIEQEDFTHLQAQRLLASHQILTEILGYRPMLHLANTTGIVNYPEYQFDAVRIGIGMYGYIDDEKTMKKLENVVTLKTVISNIHHLKQGETVSYGRRFKADRESVIATLPIGYADGIRRMAGYGKGYVKLHGQNAPIIGTICMDMMMIDVTGIPCKEGDRVIVLGESPSLKRYAEWCQTIPYEILTSIAPRVKRVYYRE